MQKLKRLRKIPNHNKYVTTTDIDNCSSAIFDERSKQASLATKSQAQVALDLGDQNKIKKLQKFGLSFFVIKN